MGGTEIKRTMEVSFDVDVAPRGRIASLDASVAELEKLVHVTASRTCHTESIISNSSVFCNRSFQPVIERPKYSIQKVHCIRRHKATL